MKVGEGTVIHPLSNIYCKQIGNNCTISNFVEIGKDVVIGNFCSIQAFVYIPEGVTLGDNVFVGPHVCFTNCKYPRANKAYVTHSHVAWLEQQTTPKFELSKTIVEDDVVIGAGSVIMCGIIIGKGAMIGAGSLILNDVESGAKIVQTRNTYYLEGGKRILFCGEVR